MKLILTADEQQRMLAALRADEDCEEAADGSFTVDLYEPEPVVSVELYPDRDGFAITAAVLMEYSEELDGYYLAKKIRDEAQLAAIAARLKETFL